jgi:hypothetical protein
MLTEYFKMNIEDPKARQYWYKEFLEHYIWVKSGKYWKPRKQHFQIGRLVYANPAEGCRYYLRILLNHVRGATSYESFGTVRGVLCPTFGDSCEKLGLITNDGSLDEAMTEAPHFQMSCALRRMFFIIAVFVSMLIYVNFGTITLNRWLRTTSAITEMIICSTVGAEGCS